MDRETKKYIDDRDMITGRILIILTVVFFLMVLIFDLRFDSIMERIDTLEETHEIENG